MIFVTGDTHGGHDLSKLNSKSFPEGKTLSKSDYVIVAGDFGFVWDGGKEDQYWLKWFDAKPFTTLFVDGNHENFDLLGAYPTSLWNGGKVHRINESVIHLMRGQVFLIDNLKIFTFGGAESWDVDDSNRIQGESWWAQEMATEEEFDVGRENLALSNWAVDYVVTHCCPSRLLAKVSTKDSEKLKRNRLTDYLDNLALQVSFKRWYFGHYHNDQTIDDIYRLLYNDIVRIQI